MVIYALDASAILRYLDNEAGANRVEAIIRGHLEGVHLAVVSAVHWGEVAGCIYKHHGQRMLEAVLSRLTGFGFEVIPVTAERAVSAAKIKADKKIPYIDAFGVDLAADSPNHVFVTADFDVKTAAQDVKIEFLPKNT